jgi:hypothetical protein
MKRKILYFLAVIFCIGFSADLKAQDVKKDYDVILLQNGEEIKAKVIEITDTQIKYKDFDFQDGPTRNIIISEVFRITYKNGKVELFSVKKTKENYTAVTDPKPINSFTQSNQDDKLNQIEYDFDLYFRTGVGISYGIPGINFQYRKGIMATHIGIGYLPYENLHWTIGLKSYWSKTSPFYIELQYGTTGTITCYQNVSHSYEESPTYGFSYMIGGDFCWGKKVKYGFNAGLGYSWSFLTFANYDVNQFDFAIDLGFIVKF